MKVKMALAMIGGGAAGVLYALASVKCFEALRILSTIPTFGGEDDFTLRFNWFLFVVLPVFAALGVWIVRSFLRFAHSGLAMLTGILIGNFITIFTIRLAQARLESVAIDQTGANQVVIGLLMLWCAFSWTGALLLKILFRQLNERRTE